jgi:hypothetical protein
MSTPSGGGTLPVVGAVAGAGGVVSGGAVGGVLPSTGSGLTVVLLVVATAMVLIGLVMVWNPLGRRGGASRVRRRTRLELASPGAPPG